jgi:hypothetical protein
MATQSVAAYGRGVVSLIENGIEKYLILIHMGAGESSWRLHQCAFSLHLITIRLEF